MAREDEGQEMKILFFTKYSRKGASSRYRTFQYLDYFRQHGVEVYVSPLLGDGYLENLYSGRRASKLYLLKSFSKRVFYIFKARKYDLVVIEKELFPHIPPVFEHLLHSINKNIVTDYDDAIFVNYQNNFLLKSKIPTVIRLSKMVNVGNQYLANYARKFNPNVNIVPTVVDLNKYKAKVSYEIRGDKVIIGWIGTPLTSKRLFEVQAALSELSKKYPIILRCIGTSPNFAMKGIRIENIKWEESKEADNILTFNVGIMPLPDNPYTRGKCGLKLIQYMACGIPSVASPVGANCDIIQDGINSLLAKSSKEWVNKIASLINDPYLSERLGREARRTVADKYSLQAVSPKLLEIYKKAAYSAMGANRDEKGKYVR